MRPGAIRARDGRPPAQRPQAKPGWRFLDPEALQRLKDLRLAARRIVEGSFGGRHRSRLRGTSVEFADYREYAPGDDLRRLDWKAFVRLARPYIRTYDEETNLRSIFLLDTSASMSFGAGGPARVSKLDHGRFLLAALAYLVIQCRDQAGLALGGDRLDEYVEPGASMPHLNRLLLALEKARPGRRTDLAAILTSLSLLARRRALLVVCSDFLDASAVEFFRAVRILRHRGFEVILFHLLDPQERDLPDGAAFRFTDPEGSHAVDASPAEIRAEYRARLDGFIHSIRKQALALGCDHERIDTDTPYPEMLQRYLRWRESV